MEGQHRQSLIVAVARRFSGPRSHLGGWRGGEDPPQSAVIGMLERRAVTSERREQGGCGAHRNRACSTPSPPDEARAGGGWRGVCVRGGGLRPPPTRHVSQGNGDNHPLHLRLRLHSGCACQYSAASAVCLSIPEMRAPRAARRTKVPGTGKQKNKPVAAWQSLKSLWCFFVFSFFFAFL